MQLATFLRIMPMAALGVDTRAAANIVPAASWSRFV
jgi:hypothetical protein